ncbi:hypothetical protein EDC01DRAFT_629118 [Geopyxis carbonaria]|nr:hypothetical protein EDC01DRAFT_629118 [Geopyxis carbonaria]
MGWFDWLFGSKDGNARTERHLSYSDPHAYIDGPPIPEPPARRRNWKYSPPREEEPEPPHSLISFPPFAGDEQPAASTSSWFPFSRAENTIPDSGSILPSWLRFGSKKDTNQGTSQPWRPDKNQGMVADGNQGRWNRPNRMSNEDSRSWSQRWLPTGWLKKSPRRPEHDEYMLVSTAADDSTSSTADHVSTIGGNNVAPQNNQWTRFSSRQDTEPIVSDTISSPMSSELLTHFSEEFGPRQQSGNTVMIHNDPRLESAAIHDESRFESAAIHDEPRLGNAVIYDNQSPPPLPPKIKEYIPKPKDDMNIGKNAGQSVAEFEDSNLDIDSLNRRVAAVVDVESRVSLYTPTERPEQKPAKTVGTVVQPEQLADSLLQLSSSPDYQRVSAEPAIKAQAEEWEALKLKAMKMPPLTVTRAMLPPHPLNVPGKGHGKPADAKVVTEESELDVSYDLILRICYQLTPVKHLVPNPPPASKPKSGAISALEAIANLGLKNNQNGEPRPGSATVNDVSTPKVDKGKGRMPVEQPKPKVDKGKGRMPVDQPKPKVDKGKGRMPEMVELPGRRPIPELGETSQQGAARGIRELRMLAQIAEEEGLPEALELTEVLSLWEAEFRRDYGKDCPDSPERESGEDTPTPPPREIAAARPLRINSPPPREIAAARPLRINSPPPREIAAGRAPSRDPSTSPPRRVEYYSPEEEHDAARRIAASLSSGRLSSSRTPSRSPPTTPPGEIATGQESSEDTLSAPITPPREMTDQPAMGDITPPIEAPGGRPLRGMPYAPPGPPPVNPQILGRVRRPPPAEPAQMSSSDSSGSGQQFKTPPQFAVDQGSDTSSDSYITAQEPRSGAISGPGSDSSIPTVYYTPPQRPAPGQLRPGYSGVTTPSGGAAGGSWLDHLTQAMNFANSLREGRASPPNSQPATPPQISRPDTPPLISLDDTPPLITLAETPPQVAGTAAEEAGAQLTNADIKWGHGVLNRDIFELLDDAPRMPGNFRASSTPPSGMRSPEFSFLTPGPETSRNRGWNGRSPIASAPVSLEPSVPGSEFDFGENDEELYAWPAPPKPPTLSPASSPASGISFVPHEDLLPHSPPHPVTVVPPRALPLELDGPQVEAPQTPQVDTPQPAGPHVSWADPLDYITYIPPVPEPRRVRFEEPEEYYRRRTPRPSSPPPHARGLLRDALDRLGRRPPVAALVKRGEVPMQTYEAAPAALTVVPMLSIGAVGGRAEMATFWTLSFVLLVLVWCALLRLQRAVARSWGAGKVHLPKLVMPVEDVEEKWSGDEKRGFVEGGDAADAV